MKFITDETLTDTLDVNTLDELKAYALGGTGRVVISFVEYHPMTGEKLPPVILKVESLKKEGE